jgi:hypothetical protein
MKDKPTIESVTNGLAKLVREVRQLQKEVAGLHASLRGFTGDNKYRIHGWNVLPPEAAGGNPAARAQTEEPKSTIERLRYEFGDNPNLEIPTKTLLAIAKELDGALRDIRAAKLDIRAIADDSDLREEFRQWQNDQNHGRG